MINSFFPNVQDVSSTHNSSLSPDYPDFPKNLRLRGLHMIIEEAESPLNINVEPTFTSSRRSLNPKEKSSNRPILHYSKSTLAPAVGFGNDEYDSVSPCQDVEYVIEKGGLNCEGFLAQEEKEKVKNPENKLVKIITVEPVMASASPNRVRHDIKRLSLENNPSGLMINLNPVLNQKNQDNNNSKIGSVEETSLRNPLEGIYGQAEEDIEDFLMIRPLIGTANASPEENFLKKNDLISLDSVLFPKKIINYANSLPQDDIAEDFRQLVWFIAQNNDKEFVDAKNNSSSDILYSIALKSQVFSTAKILLKALSEKLKLEPVSLQVKYKSEIQDIEVNFVKLMRHERSNNIPGPFRLKEKELEKLIQSIDTLRKEEYILVSREMLNSAHQFYMKLLDEILIAHNLDDTKFKNGVQIDHVTLPKLLDKAIEAVGSSSFRKLVIYTYDLYTSPLNLLTYFIFKFFLPRHESMDKSKFVASKLQILNIMQFWLEVRTPDFILHPDLTLLFDIFLEISQLQDGQNGFEVIDTLDTLSSVYTSVINTVPTKARKTYFSKVISYDEDNNCTLNIKSFCNKRTSAVTIPTFYMCKESLIDNLSMGFLTPEAESPEKFVKKRKEKREGIPYNHKSLMERSTDEIARQLTLIDYKIFSHINVREIINKRWTKNGKNSDCPTYWKYVSRFNNFAYWLQYTIVSMNSQTERMAFVKKFIDVALLCTQRYKNYCSPHYIFSALVSLENFGVISFESPLLEDYQELRATFAPNESYVHIYERTFRNMRAPAIPSLNFFLKVFLKLQDGVAFKTKLPDSNSCYLKFPILVQVEDYCNEMRRFQKKGYQDKIQKDWNLYRYLKSDFKNEMDMNLGDSDALMESLVQMINRNKHRKVKLLDYLFGSQKKENHGEG